MVTASPETSRAWAVRAKSRSVEVARRARRCAAAAKRVPLSCAGSSVGGVALLGRGTLAFMLLVGLRTAGECACVCAPASAWVCCCGCAVGAAVGSRAVCWGWRGSLACTPVVYRISTYVCVVALWQTCGILARALHDARALPTLATASQAQHGRRLPTCNWPASSSDAVGQSQR